MIYTIYLITQLSQIIAFYFFLIFRTNLIFCQRIINIFLQFATIAFALFEAPHEKPAPKNRIGVLSVNKILFNSSFAPSKVFSIYNSPISPDQFLICNLFYYSTRTPHMGSPLTCSVFLLYCTLSKYPNILLRCLQ